MKTQPFSSQHIILIFTLIFIWSGGWFFTKIGLESSAPLSFNAIRFLLAATIMQITLNLTPHHKSASKRHWPVIIAIGILQTGLMFSLASYGMMQTNLTKTVILVYTTPLWASFLGWRFLNEKLDKTQWAGLFLGLTGIAFIILPEIKLGKIFGISILLTSALSWSIANLLFKKYLSSYDKLYIGTWQITIGAVFLLTLSILIDREISFHANMHSITSLLYVSIFGSIIAFSTWFHLVTKLSLLQSSMVTLGVSITIMAADAIQNENMSSTLVTGMLCILLGIYFAIKND
jgi:drug/metabolite transporter (DMT)-like permease